MEPTRAVAEAYRAFAEEAGDDSPCFAAWATSVAADQQVLRWIARLPESKQQPNLVLAAARWHGVPAPGPYDGLREALLSDGAAIRETILQRSTQTNEPLRQAVLMPVLGRIAAETDGPLALVEVGASAGLCLYPDRYDYEWTAAGRLTGSGGPTLRCDVRGPVPVPASAPVISWRGGSDLDPIDVTDADRTAWLRALVWPEQEERRRRLAAAIAVAASSPPHLVRGDLMETLDEVIEAASPHGTVVVQHSAVIAYLDPAERHAFAIRMTALVAERRVRWVSNEGARVLPEITRTASSAGLPSERFVLGLDGRAMAWGHGHGASLTWLP